MEKTLIKLLSTGGLKEEWGGNKHFRAAGVAQLVEWLLPIPEVCGLNPVIGKIYIAHLYTVICIEKTKIKQKRPRIAHKNFFRALLLCVCWKFSVIHAAWSLEGFFLMLFVQEFWCASQPGGSFWQTQDARSSVRSFYLSKLVQKISKNERTENKLTFIRRKIISSENFFWLWKLFFGLSKSVSLVGGVTLFSLGSRHPPHWQQIKVRCETKKERKK